MVTLLQNAPVSVAAGLQGVRVKGAMMTMSQ